MVTQIMDIQFKLVRTPNFTTKVKKDDNKTQKIS
jgi:hypothetical protein